MVAMGPPVKAAAKAGAKENKSDSGRGGRTESGRGMAATAKAEVKTKAQMQEETWDKNRSGNADGSESGYASEVNCN